VFEDREDPVERIVSHVRRPVRIDPALDGRVMQEIARGETVRVPGAAAAGWRWLTRPRQFAVSPLGALAMAAGLAAVILALPRRGPGSGRAAEDAPREFQFVVVAPRAARVALVGDFNDWDATRTPMRPSQRGGSVWSAVLPLSPGRYRYAFLVDGSRWLADPAAPRARDDEFGTPSSVVTVGGS
jgi:predicted carbohydrate-binding protein with CBM48